MSEDSDNPTQEGEVIDIVEESEPEPLLHPKKIARERNKIRNTVDRETYEKIWECFYNGGMTITKAAVHLGLTVDIVHKIYYYGMPSVGWPSIRDRAKAAKGELLMESQKNAPKPKDAVTPRVIAGETTQPEIWEDWAKIKRENLQLGTVARGIFANLLKKCINAANTATTTKFVRRKDTVTGEWQTVEENMTLQEVSSAMKTIVSAVKELGVNDSLFSDKPTERKEEHHILGAFGKLSPEQMEYLIANDGKLPPGAEELLLEAMETPDDSSE